jgi:uncharacterized protein YbjT (DUF2867 family)
MWSRVGERPEEFGLGKWLRSIERGFAQADNNHFKPLIRGVPRAIDHVTNRQAILPLASARIDGFEMPRSRMKETIMKIVVIGGTGLIGSKLVNKLREHGHEAVAAAPNTGVNTVTGEGLAEVLKGASVVVDVSNSPNWEDAAVLNFFETSTRNLLTYEAAAGVEHHVALSVVGTDRLSESGYFRAKIAQEKLIRESSIPYSIVQATQFFEFLKGLADISMVGGKVHLPHVLFQPMAADDVASGVGTIAEGQPVNGIVEIGGAEQFRVDELVRRRLATLKDTREVVADPNARYAGAKLSEKTLVPGNNARLGETRFETWLTQPAAQVPSAHPQPTGVAVVTNKKETLEKAS